MDTKQAISEKQGLVDEMEMQLMSSAPESIPCVVELRDELNALYDDVSQVLDKKMDMQNLVEEYRMMLQDFFSWLDTLIKRAENADKGRGNTIAQRVSLLEQLTAETGQGKPKLATLTTKVIVSQLLKKKKLILIFTFYFLRLEKFRKSLAPWTDSKWKNNSKWPREGSVTSSVVYTENFTCCRRPTKVPRVLRWTSP